MHAPRTWILIADAAHARVLEATGRTQPLVDVPSMSLHVDLPPTHELGSERPGRTIRLAVAVTRSSQERTPTANSKELLPLLFLSDSRRP